MNRKFKIYALIWAILLVLFNIVCFVTPSKVAGISKFSGSFWVGYAFISAAFIGQLVCAYIALKTDDKTKLFYNIPIIHISYTGLILMLVFGAACMAIPFLPYWVGVIVCCAVTAFTAIAVIKAKAASDIVEKIDNKVKAQTFFIKALTVDAESLMARAETDEAKAACKKVYEAVRYSDPMSSDALAPIESQITLRFNDLSAAVSDGADNISKISDEIVLLLGDRNKRCKVLK